MSWTPVRKVAAAIIAAVIIPGVIAILQLGPGLLNLSGREWATLLIASFAPPLVAYLTSAAKPQPPTP